MSKPDSDLWLDVKDLWLYKAIGLEYIKKISVLKYRIKNYVMIKPTRKLK